MNPVISLRGLTFTYPGQSVPALDGVDLEVCPGEFLVLCGPSGCGKSTLLRHLKTILAPHGTGAGEVLFRGRPLAEYDQRAQAEGIGFVLQSPDNQLVTDKVWHELAFGLESLGCDTPTIRRRVAEMASFFGIQGWFYKDVAQLSGGQKQLLNLASVMVMQPEVLILDEPTAQLDPIAASDFLAALGKLNRELGTTIILTEHRLEEAFALATQAAVMERGRILAVGTPREVGLALRRRGHPMFLAMPAPMRIWAGVPESGETCPVTVREGRDWLTDYAQVHPLGPVPTEEKAPGRGGEPTLTAEGLWFRYEQDAPEVVKGLTITANRGEILALLGGNGTGKTTALKLMAGLLKPQRGSVQALGTVRLLPQDPQALFVKKSLKEDLTEHCKGLELEPGRLEEVIKLCRLEDLLDRHPFDLSGGEQQRAALAKLLLTDPGILLLDEPTKGLDADFKREFAQILQGLTAQGATVVLVSHDIEFCARYAHRCALFFDGGVVNDAPTRAFFSGNSFYTTAANRMARELLPQAVTVRDVIAACAGEDAEKPAPPPPAPAVRSEKPPVAPVIKRPVRRSVPKRAVWSVLFFLLLIPLTLVLGQRYLDSRKYYIIALLILLECMVPFFLVFEKRRPQARELVLIAVLCAIGVAGRAAFFMLPECKPVTALVVVVGAALGGETGFLVGSMTMLLSNMLLSQGPWTPWQMFAMGLIGFLAGLIFRKGALGRSRWAMAVFGAVAALVLYGGIMNFQSALTWSYDLNFGIVLSYVAAGLPMDLVHAASTFVFLVLGGEAVLEKLERIKLKYGLAE